MERKEGPKNQGQKKGVVAKGQAAKKVKVVDVNISTAQKKRAAKGGEAKQPVSKFRASADKVRKQVKSAAAPVTAKKGSAAAAVKGQQNSSEVSAYFVSPPPAVLRSFRKAAEQNRKNAKNLQRARARGVNFLAKQPKAGKRYTVDLRVHSPGTLGYFSTGGVDPGPALVRLAKVKGIDVIGLTDYYNASFVDSVKELAARSNVTVLPGLDLRCQIGDCREVYLTALFPETVTSADLFRVLEALAVPAEMQGSRDYCLTVSCAEVIRVVEENGGVLIPSRVDKTPYRQLAIPHLIEQFGFHAFDLVHPEHLDFFRERWPEGQFTFLTFSNANALAQIGSRIAKLRLAEPSFAAIKELVGRRV